MAETPRGYPYPDGDDQPDVPYWLQQLAEAVNDDVASLAADTGWLQPSFSSANWNDPTYDVAYRRKGNEVWLHGQAQPAAGASDVIMTLPEGFRPSQRVTHIVSTGSSTTVARVVVEPNGNVQVAGTVSAVTFDAIRYLVA